ncbi:hypothetical protein O6H91_09G009100 [Diphasiastrum complanatum]|uniref:Uncharacterized protein n=1 Tax=Diphasiastrum complanatum TaxID=34168 RepID=A0ACC2CL62_DIPCM|nr:hypothetical protein O6H91_09G009100 [Diphasiastrum complanatum]
MENLEGTNASEEESLESLLYPAPHELPLRPLPAIKCNYTHHFALNVMGKDRHDQYVYRHANGLCIIGLAPTHVVLHPTPSVIGVDFNVGKQSRVEMKACGKRKRNAHILESNSVLCKVMTSDQFFLIRPQLKVMLQL